MLAVDSAIATRQTSTPSRSDKPPFGSRTPSVRVARLARCYSAPFIVDKNSIQQGYLTSEPLEVRKQGGFHTNVFLLADYGYTTYSTLVETRHEIVEKHPDMVQRFVDASTIGWYHYLYGDNSKADEAIKKENPEITDEQIAFSIAKMKGYGIVDSGDTLKLGSGAMTDQRWSDFYHTMVKAGVVKAGIDYKKAYTLQFVNKGVGLDLRPSPIAQAGHLAQWGSTA